MRPVPFRDRTVELSSILPFLILPNTDLLICSDSKRSLKRHKLIHQGATPFLCSFCKKKFRSKALLEKHAKQHNQ